MLALALIFGLAPSGHAVGEGELERLIERTNALASFSARYSITTTTTDSAAKQDVPQSIRIDYSAPGRVRVETQLSSGATLSWWCVEGVYTVAAPGKDAVHGRVDYATVRKRVAELERAVSAHIPLSAPAGGAGGAGVNMRWSFDDKAQKANYYIEAYWADEQRTVLGWLATLRSKKAELHAEGELLTFVTDGEAFHGALSAKSGFLEDLWGKSPSGEAHIHLDQLELDGEIDAARFATPDEAPAGRDVSADLVRSFTGLATRGLRTRIYRSLAAEPGEPWVGEERAKIESGLREFHVVAVSETLASWRESALAKRDGVAERLRELAKTKTPEQVAAAREKERGYLSGSLDDLDAGFAKRLSAPETDAPLARADELLALEHEVLARVFDETVRQPVLADFERATEPKNE